MLGWVGGNGFPLEAATPASQPTDALAANPTYHTPHQCTNELNKRTNDRSFFCILFWCPQDFWRNPAFEHPQVAQTCMPTVSNRKQNRGCVARTNENINCSTFLANSQRLSLKTLALANQPANLQTFQPTYRAVPQLTSTNRTDGRTNEPTNERARHELPT